MASFNLSAVEMRSLTNWPEPVIEDYLDAIRSINDLVRDADSVRELERVQGLPPQEHRRVFSRLPSLLRKTQPLISLCPLLRQMGISALTQVKPRLDLPLESLTAQGLWLIQSSILW